MMNERKQARKANCQREEVSAARRKRLEKAAPDFLEAAKDFLKGWSHFCDCIDFGSSFLDAKAIRFMNEVPGKIRQAVNKAERE